MVKFSVILPVRNGGEYFKQCVCSILTQNYSGFNLIILDNNSNDGSLEWINSLNDIRIEVYFSGVPLTIEENWARILSIPKNEFMTMIGHDDILLPDFLAEMNTMIIANPEAGLYQTHFNFINQYGKITKDCMPMPAQMSSNEFIKKTLRFEVDLNGTGYVCRSADYDKTGGIPLYPNLLFSDYALWISLVSKRKIVVSPGIYFQYRIHQNTSKIASQYTFIEALFQFCSFLKKEADRGEESIKQNAPVFIAAYCKSIAHKMLRVPLKVRYGLYVGQFVDKMEGVSEEIAGSTQKHLFNTPGIKLARVIDSNIITAYLFRKFKAIYKKPLLN